MTVACLLLLWVDIHYSDPLHFFLRSVLFVLLCTKMSARFLCRLNAMIDGSGKTDFILSDLWRIDNRCCTILLTSGRALEYVITKGTLSSFCHLLVYIQVGIPVFCCQLSVAVPLSACLDTLSFWQASFFPFDYLHPCWISASSGCQAHMEWPSSLMWDVLTLCEDISWLRI